MRGKINILDCTLREAGYLNNWQFSPENVQEYINSLRNYGVDIAELGFRYNIKDKNYGICAYCPDEFVNGLDLPAGLQVAVMIKAEQFVDLQDLRQIFDEKKNSRIDIVRLAVNYQKAAETGRVIEVLKQKGYKVSLNITKIYSDSKIYLPAMGNFDFLYLADTYGELKPDDVARIVVMARLQFGGPVGFHAHNNGNVALKNALAAIESGAACIDSTIGGVGKGSGNLKTEDIVKELKYGTKGLHILQNCEQGV